MQSYGRYEGLAVRKEVIPFHERFTCSSGTGNSLRFAEAIVGDIHLNKLGCYVASMNYRVEINGSIKGGLGNRQNGVFKTLSGRTTLVLNGPGKNKLRRKANRFLTSLCNIRESSDKLSPEEKEQRAARARQAERQRERVVRQKKNSFGYRRSNFGSGTWY